MGRFGTLFIITMPLFLLEHYFASLPNFATVRWSLGNGDTIIILNDRPNAGDASPLIQKDRLDNKWYMVARADIRRREVERKLVGGLVPESQRGWVRADFLSRVRCPH